VRDGRRATGGLRLSAPFPYAGMTQFRFEGFALRSAVSPTTPNDAPVETGRRRLPRPGRDCKPPPSRGSSRKPITLRISPEARIRGLESMNGIHSDPWWRRLRFWPGAVEREAQTLALEFARHLSGRTDDRTLLGAAGSAHPDAFWSALEVFTENIAGTEWRLLSRKLRGLPVVRREIARLGHRSAWRRAIAVRHLGLLNAPGIRR